jgi:RNA polymerase sigma factor (sigma-70 family)
MTPDSELLRRYAGTKSEEAFAELVQRHVNLVYSAALRQVNGDAHLAQDVAQTVFTDLARKAGSLARREVLTGWLYTSAHFAAAKIARTENRRREREEKFMREPIPEPAPDPGFAEARADWEKIRPSLDEAMHELKEPDREAILLRFFENRPFAEIGEKIGLSENAARMRVERALEKLRGLLVSRGVTTAAALASVISANAVQIAPAGLAATLTNASLAATGTGTTLTLLKLMTMTKLKLGLSALVVASAATALVVQHQTQSELRDDNQSLRQQITQLRLDNQSLSNRLLAVGETKSLTDEQYDELLRLRGEVGVLCRETNELGRLRAENRQLKASLPSASQQKQASETDRDAEQEKAFAQSKMNDARQFLLAVWLYADDHQGQFPTSFDQITNSFNYNPNVLSNMSQLQIVYQGSRTNITNPGSTIVVESPPWQKRSGTWAKVYGFADGHSQLVTDPNGDFSSFEQEHTAQPTQNQ